MNRYQAMTKICLNNWHYINEKVLSFHDEINFFTGHSGSGKSTVLDALQIVLYADSNGRGFFNKAAKEDSDRTLIEYLRGMKVVQENNNISYLRNKNFSSTIVLEFQDTETKAYQSIGIIFDVDVSTNEMNRMFFWHKGELLPNCYRDGEKVLSLHELREYMKEHFTQEEYFFSRTNEKFRNELYSNYFGGLHPKHFPALFKKAIPFKMDMKLEDFVKNYICTENDIHMEDMQDSVASYTRLKRKLEDTKQEIHLLEGLQEQFLKYHQCYEQVNQYQYYIDKLDIEIIKSKIDYAKTKQGHCKSDIEQLENRYEGLKQKVDLLYKQRDEVMIAIQNSGYDSLEAELGSLNQVLELLYRSKAGYDKIAEGLTAWNETNLLDDTSQEVIRKVKTYEASYHELVQIQDKIQKVRANLSEEKEKISLKSTELKNEIAEHTRQIETLKSGQKAYPGFLLEAKSYLIEKLEQIYKKQVPVDILADVIDVQDDTWLNAVEGYMGNNKLSLVVSPEYAAKAMEAYKELDPKKYYKVSVIDTERVLSDRKPAQSQSLAMEVTSKLDYAKAYVDFLMGTVIKCSTMDELRENRSGITADCVLYQGYKLQHINPRNYTEHAYIGGTAIERRLRQLEEKVSILREEKKPFDEHRIRLEQILGFESLNQEMEALYTQMLEMNEIKEKEAKKQEYIFKIQELKNNQIDVWKQKQQTIEEAIHENNSQKDMVVGQISNKKKELEEAVESVMFQSESLIEKEKLFSYEEIKEQTFSVFMDRQNGKRLDFIKSNLGYQQQLADQKAHEEFERLVKKRENYRNDYTYRGLSLTNKENIEYDQLLDNLRSDKLSEFTEKANEQAKQAIYHFKSDFIYKIRDAIKEVMQQKDDLNRILSQLNFGKDKYRFIITKNKGENGRYYDMFMDENLEINPHKLLGNVENQMDFFTMQHEKDYSDLINELLELFMPPDHSDAKALEEARANMELYSDYRSYLSFDMEQIVEGMPPMRLSKMLTKNSGGEGQNPLYVALLASFAQVYRINLKANIRRKPTPRLVVLDEAFSKMDAEKVGSCIGLIRELGFQAIISATNDKIQNYVDNVDKTFVFANPNKSRISIQEFEKREFRELLITEGDEDSDID